MERERRGAVRQADRSAAEDPPVQRGTADAPLREREPGDGGEQREQRGQQDDDGELPDALDVLVPPAPFLSPPAQLDGDGRAGQQDAEQDQVMFTKGSEPRRDTDRSDVGGHHRQHEHGEPTGQRPDRPVTDGCYPTREATDQLHQHLLVQTATSSPGVQYTGPLSRIVGSGERKT